jgi:hypothetical protein
VTAYTTGSLKFVERATDADQANAGPLGELRLGG